VIGAGGHNADTDAVRRVGTGEMVDDVQDVLRLEVRDHLPAQAVESVLGERLVDVAPPDAPLRPGLPDDKLVLGRAAGVLAGVHDERPPMGQRTVAAPERLGVELGGRRIPEDPAGGGDSVGVEADAGHGRRDRHVWFLLGVLLMAVDLRGAAADRNGTRKPVTWQLLVGLVATFDSKCSLRQAPLMLVARGRPLRG
jgi:hypothetical protein